MKLTGDKCQCSACDELFNSTFAFDKHRRGRHGVNRRCLTPDDMLAVGMALNQRGFWISAGHKWGREKGAERAPTQA